MRCECLLKTPFFTITALATLTLGIGANTAIFSVINAVLLKPLAYPDPDRIVFFLLSTRHGPSYGSSATKFNVWKQQTQIFEQVAAYEYGGSGLNLTGGDRPEQVRGIRVTADYFRLFGAPLALGRTFTASEDRPNGGRVAVLSHGLWQRRYGGDRNLIGQTISLSGVPYVVVGIAGAGFHTELDAPPDVWLPFQIDPNSTDHAQYFTTVARLKPGVTLAQANAQLRLASDVFRRHFPDLLGPRDSFTVEPFQDSLISDVRPALLVLAGAVCLVFVMACANVASLLLVRSAGRKHEIAVRAATGAGRGRILRQLLTESLVLSMAGGGLGLAAGLAGVRALLALNPGDIPRLRQAGAAVHLDWQIVAFAVVAFAISGALVGLLPALEASRADLSTMLKEGGGRSGTGLGQNTSHSVLVVGEVPLALVLLVGAALLIRTFFELHAVNPGFDPHQVLTLRMSLAGSRFQKTADVNILMREAIPHMERLPGVSHAAASYSLPLEGGFGVPFNIQGRMPAAGKWDGRGWIGVTPGYFGVFAIPVIRGRAFTDRDGVGATPVAIINQALARQFWPQGEPLGARLVLGQGYGPEFEEPAREIVGVVGDVHDAGLNLTPGPMVYVPLAQVTDGITALVTRAVPIVWLARTRQSPRSLATALEQELTRASGGLPVASMRSMEEVMVQSTARSDFNLTLLAIFGSAALLLAAIGIYGLMAYSVQQRTQELGIRLALGADAGQVRNMVIRQGMVLACSGIAIGLAAAAALSRLLESFLFGVKASDPLVFITVPAMLACVSLLAVWLPARRAARIDPVIALRQG